MGIIPSFVRQHCRLFAGNVLSENLVASTFNLFELIIRLNSSFNCKPFLSFLGLE